ncbi:phosphoglucomutase/phosphomannomutase, alpha/beta/alpha domain I - III [Chlamydia pneumoniae LPCoLN]|uniref:phospho-sugar mutase n=1 Tax=Chlamydia pneumoniae TaxID=83558 RepID=UPI0001BD9E14|nr:phospho-sugar mutase [Chlamydia pneumoniae]ACZ33029.1 phosphoglucomutase/phosphomannomutase, alpha/beta/alpha domain I - III [Chlamydia pneumoniae LPCoLN]ETR79943.1 Phosphomannomutase [Chlamydia pneumoniae B21]
MKEVEQRIRSLYDAVTAENICRWLSNDCTQQDAKTILGWLDTDPAQLEDLFGATLTFGTGGLRSLMGIGTNRINLFTIRRTTQGLVQVLRAHLPHPGDPMRVVVGCDTRHNSIEFAQETAKVLAGNGCEVFLFQYPEPLALVSFTVRYERAIGGVMITASHNPPNYNGYKVYMASGGQVLPPLDQEIVAACSAVNEILSVPSIDHPNIHLIGKEYEALYRDTLKQLQLYPEANRISGRSLSISYSPLHGTGISLVPHVLKDWGFLSVHLVEKQAIGDGDFPTVQLPNPEDPEALTLGIEQMLANDDDLFIATDPDADRVGVVCLEDGQPYRFNGNQMASLLADHILGAWSKTRHLGEHDKLVKSLVTTEMLSAIAKHYHVDLINVGTGFKYIGEKIESWRNSTNKFVFGAEESYGCLYGTHVEDKDAIIASALIAEAALQQKLQGKTLRDALLSLYETYGYFANKTESVVFSAKTDEQEIRKKLSHLEEISSANFFSGKYQVEKFENYKQGIGFNLLSKDSYALTLPKTSMLCYYFSGGGRVIIRPSGTEPKIKFYFEMSTHYPERVTDKEIQKQREAESFQHLDDFIFDFKEKFSNL